MGRKKLPTVEKRRCQIKAHLTQAEYDRVVELSQKTDLTVSEFIRRLALGIKIESTEHHADIMALLKMHADFNRVGGLLKLAISEGRQSTMIVTALHQLNQTRQLLHDKITAIAP